MNVNVIEILPQYSVVEFTDELGFIQRRILPQGLHPLSTRGPATISEEVLWMGLEYSNVDLVSVLGEVLPAIRVRDLEDRLRRAGLWTQQDYQTHSDVVNGVWQKTRGVDVTRIVNAALSGLK